MGNIAGSYNAGSGVLTLTSSGATATVAQWQAALRAVSYGNSALAPDTASRSISFRVNDGGKESASASRTVSVTVPAQAPLLTGSAGSVPFTAGDGAAATPVAVDAGLTLSDRDSPTLASARVAITGNFQAGEDVLAFSNHNAASFGNITGSYDSASGVLTLTSAGATATLAQWQAALRAVTYTDSADTPKLAARAIEITVSDGAKSSNAVTRGITMVLPDYTPVLGASGGQASFVIGGAATPVLVDGCLQLADRDSATLASASVRITGNFQAGEDVLAFVNDNAARYGNIAASYNGGSGVLTLVSSGATATVAQWQAALRAVTYADSAATPTMAARTVAFSVNDGGRDSQPVTRAVQLSVPTPQIDGLAAGSDTGASASDGVTANASPTLSGKAVAGAQVAIWVDGVVLDSTTADGSGNWRYAFASTLSDGMHQVRAVTRSGGVDSQPSAALTLRIDTQAPAGPADIKLSSGTAARPAINGKAEAGSSVTVLIDGAEAGKVRADGSGAWAWQGGTALADGQHRISAVATDLAGNASAATAALAFTVDTRIPLPPAPPPPALGLAPGADTGSSASDGLTSQNRPTVSGTAQAGSTVTVYVDGAVAGAVRADADGAWRYTVGTALADGQHGITAVAENAGGKSAASAVLALRIDTAAPGAPAIAGLGENPAQPQFSGSAEANSSVTVYLDNVTVATVQADASGRWTYQPSGLLAEGQHTVRAVAVDAAGNTGVSSAARSWTVDSRPPAAPAGLGLAAGSDTGASASDGLTSARQPLIQGTAAAGSRVTISLDGVAAGSTVADAQGAWSFRPGADLADGQHRVTAQAFNAAGVGSAASAPLLLSIDTAAPRVVAITALDATASQGGSLRYEVQFSKAVALTADAFSLTFGGGAQARIVSITPSGEGRYLVQLSASGEGSVALALRQGGASDLAGNVLGQGGSGSAYQLQALPPPPPPPVAEIRPAAGSQPGSGSRPAGDAGSAAHAGTPIVPTIVLDTVAATGEPLWLGHSAAAGGMPTLATPAWGVDRFAASGVSEGFSGSAVPGFVLRGFHDMGTRALEQGSSFEIRLPAETPGARATQPAALVRVQLSDGRALPGWLRYDAQAGRIVGKVPPGWQQDLTVEVRSVDEAGHEHVTQLKLRPGAPAEVKAKGEDGKEAPAKAAFNEQLRQYGKDAFEQQLAAWLRTDEAA
ncbi:Ig-like domain-containing protein [Massilia sp. YIM B04103]|uniref:Ig-like domain-containing protein n=1 Tax=Massilia sp. YIM B04103 TaxID=2963106 RepID=UPI0027D9B7E6|nr:Ig-like domain-containing protein [Massilia sp. YIM B04103]